MDSPGRFFLGEHLGIQHTPGAPHALHTGHPELLGSLLLKVSWLLGAPELKISGIFTAWTRAFTPQISPWYPRGWLCHILPVPGAALPIAPPAPALLLQALPALPAAAPCH